jgi:hypothetical protein
VELAAAGDLVEVVLSGTAPDREARAHGAEDLVGLGALAGGGLEEAVGAEEAVTLLDDVVAPLLLELAEAPGDGLAGARLAVLVDEARVFASGRKR